MAINPTIQYINPIDSSLISYDGKNFKNLTKKENLYTISRILYEDIIVYSFKIPSIQISDDLSSLVEIKMYEEAGLDVNKSYKLTYIIKKLDFDEMDLIEAFAIDLDRLRDIFKDCIKKVKYIDFLTLPFFTFRTFYTNKILTGKNDIFVYIDENEAFSSFYKDGSYISTKSIINLSEIVEKLNAKDIHINIKELSDTLVNKGFNQDLYERNESDLFNSLESIFSDVLTKINNVAMHNRNIYGFDKIDRLFFSTREGRIKGLKEFVGSFGLADVQVLDFNLFREKQESGFLDKITASYGLDKFKEHSNIQNVTIFKRAPSFFRTKFGKLISSAAVLFIILFGIFAYFYLDIQNLKKEENILQSRYNILQQKAKKYKVDISKKINEISKTKEEIKKQEIVFKNIKASIDKLEQMKGKDNRYISFLAVVNTLLQKYGLHTRSIEQIGKKSMEIEVVTEYKSRDKIANFLKALIEKGFVDVKTNEIKLDNKSYISKIGISRE